MHAQVHTRKADRDPEQEADRNVDVGLGDGLPIAVERDAKGQRRRGNGVRAGETLNMWPR
jgi:hypothetical protein